MNWHAWPTPASLRIPASRPSVAPEDVAAAADAVQSGWLARGPSIGSVESALSARMGMRTLSCANGSVALVLALRSLGIRAGDEVLVPAITYAATASSIVQLGAVPVFCDVRRDNWTLDIDSIRRMTTDRTRAIIPVHLYGHACAMDEILTYAEDHGVFVVEDAAEALGASSSNRPLGTLGDAGTWSFFGNKLITCGEGGAITTRSKETLERVSLLRGQGMDPQRQFWFLDAGYNFRLSNLSASVLLSQLSRLDQIIATRDAIFLSYRDQLAERLVEQVPIPGSTPSPWLFTALLRPNARITSIALAKSLASEGIETRPIFIPLPEMPAFSGFPHDSYPIACEISSRGLSLPTFTDMSDSDVATVTSVIQRELG